MSLTNSNRTLLKTFIATVLFSTISFAATAGGDTYQIYLNNKLVFKQRVLNSSPVDLNSLQLTKANYNDELEIYYNHCGVTGTGRSVEIKDEQNHILKEWKFKDANVAMSIPVKEILELQKNNPNAVLNLYYFSSKYLPKGRMIASIKMQGKNTTMNKKVTGNKDDMITKNISTINLIFWHI
jgi:hypothetical protein